MHEKSWKNEKIEVTLSRTVNIGNYESKKIQVGLTVDVLEGESLQNAYSEVKSVVLDQLNKIAKEI